MGWDRGCCCCGHRQTLGSFFNSTPLIQHQHPSLLHSHLLQFPQPKNKKIFSFSFFGNTLLFIFSFLLLVVGWLLLLSFDLKVEFWEGYWYDLSFGLFCYQPSLVRFFFFWVFLFFAILIILNLLGLALIFLWVFLVFVLLGFMGYHKTASLFFFLKKNFWGFRFFQVLL